ncbi:MULTISPECIES: hypothetical protein [Phyllobacteriaceae]|jgi:hypothetical protein|nr:MULTISPECIES: hypothetical protein [Mesorhizobium]MDQ0332759.1 putative lysophospholipase L1 biosynthesis ABC-type transport system permease subunit [Mesorhizobium sp. YL-MeA3-2017]
MNALPQMARPAFAGLRNGVYLMKKLVLIAALGAAAVASAQFAARAAETPCEDSLKALRAAEAATKVKADVKPKLDELETKGIERCKADDDKRANDFFGQAMKLLGK